MITWNRLPSEFENSRRTWARTSGRIRAGRTLTITDRGRPVATVTAADMRAQSFEARLARLRAEGVVTGTGSHCRRSAIP